MEFKTVLSQLRQIAADNEYTSAQAAAVTKQQMSILLAVSATNPRWTGPNYGFFVGLRNALVTELRVAEDEVMRQAIKDKLTPEEKVWIKERFGGREL